MGWKSWIKNLCGETFELAYDDIVVFLVGPSGGGKSGFVEEVTKSANVKVSASLQPCTTKVQAIRCVLTEEAKITLGATVQKNIVFVDTPSFHTSQNDAAAESAIRNWLNKSKCRSTLMGTIYVHRVETDPRYESIGVQHHLDTFANTFPDDFISVTQWRVHAVLSYEGKILEDTIRPRRETLQEQFHALRPSLPGNRVKWVTSFHPKLFRRGDSETAWKAVEALFSQP